MLSMARSLLRERNVPSKFWGEAVRHAVYVLNRLSTRGLTDSTPYEAWSGQKPDVGHIKIFGCCAYMKIPNVYTKKLDDRSKLVVYFGREPGTKAHRLYDPAENKIYVSRDVVFDEPKTWTWAETDAAATETPTQFIIVEGVQSENEDHEPSTPVTPAQGSILPS